MHLKNLMRLFKVSCKNLSLRNVQDWKNFFSFKNINRNYKDKILQFSIQDLTHET